ncbi:hypothetical protein ACFO4P_07600 [Epilithonimonas pallida]|mgnify:CR=1 FL=1|uniref:Uncharacterized protein n=1 Tax=Epilithonimonas pallida TaxID=373671 RepID=A0ABY1R4P0_9FLAO|nr:hypothetical protein [Epilithonimonas pallida]SMP94190.1 hypothetical protein SAMN05421679_105272 [Epilithonimonas pallida]
MDINSSNFEVFEKEIIGKTREEIEAFLKFPLVSKCDEQYIYIIKRRFFGLYKKRLYLYFIEEELGTIILVLDRIKICDKK